MFSLSRALVVLIWLVVVCFNAMVMDAAEAGVVQVPASSITYRNECGFGDRPLQRSVDVIVSCPWLNFPKVPPIRILDRVWFAERFEGQVLSYADVSGAPIPPSTFPPVFDVLSPNAQFPKTLSLVTGLPGQNLSFGATSSSRTVLSGNGPQGPTPLGIAEGSIAVLFEADQEEFALEILGANPSQGSHTIFNFFRRDGLLLDTIDISDISDGFVAFRYDKLFRSIAGFTIHTDDNGGLGYDNLRYTWLVLQTPEPPSVSPVFLGVAVLVLRRRNRLASC